MLTQVTVQQDLSSMGSWSVRNSSVVRNSVRCTRLSFDLPDKPYSLKEQFATELSRYIDSSIHGFDARAGLVVVVAPSVRVTAFDQGVAKIERWVEKWLDSHRDAVVGA